VKKRETLSLDALRYPCKDIDWIISDAPVPYEDAISFMDERVQAIREGKARECIWILEHPALITAGTSANMNDLLAKERFPVYKTGRGGELTYHGPGQRVVYVMLDLNRRVRDLRLYVAGLEEWIITLLHELNIQGERREDRVGIWVPRPDKGPGQEDKIAAIGIRVRHWITLHGFSLNVNPELEHFQAIVPCGIQDHGVTSLWELGHLIDDASLDSLIRESFNAIFGPEELEHFPFL
jgi:lipoyl(octanoyl) transferase